ncbi:uncharacterized protein LOC144921571 isoform X2 [Branchiostoma floridae x Branchiostoma belcheri]
MMIHVNRDEFLLALFCALLGLLIPRTSGADCSSKFPTGGLIASCKHADDKHYSVKELKSPQYADGTTCLFQCIGGAPVERECRDGQWRGYGIACLTIDVNIKEHGTAKAHHRSKRGLGAALAAAAAGAAVGAGVNYLLGHLFGSGSETTTVYETLTDTYPPSISCPPDIAETAERGSTSVKIDNSTWRHPIKATDTNAEGDIVHPEALLTGLPVSSRFERGVTELTYSYTDGGGNSAQCVFKVTVTVPECNLIPPDEYGTWDCTGAEESYIHGSNCTLNCIRGYQASNSTTVTCGANGTWSGDISNCSIKSCSTAPNNPENGRRDCSEGQTYNSVCAFTCDDGYTISGSHSQLCTTADDSMTWVPKEAPTCKDTQPPQLSCPDRIKEFRAAEGTTTALVSWEEPTASDNSGEEILPVQITNIANNDSLPAGYYDIQYKATDSAGQSSSCIFGIRVKVVSCSPNQLYLPLGTFTCDDNQFIWGSKCSFQCSLGYKLTGQEDTVCQNTGKWNTSGVANGDAPSCDALPCPDYSVPANGNGNSGCTNASFGEFCHISCDPGYDLQGVSTTRCIASGDEAQEGEWDNTNSTCLVRTCPAMHSPKYGNLTGECDGQEVPFGTQCHFSCNKGYWLKGSGTNNCLVNGRWEYATPHCKAKTCHASELPTPTNGVKSGCPNEVEYYGTTCVLSCPTGYQPKGDHHVTCENSDNSTEGKWDDDKFSSCNIVKCPAPQQPGNGSIVMCQYDSDETDPETDQKYSTVCSMTCDEGFTVTRGTLRRTCTEMATWDGSELQCEDVTSPLLYCPNDQVYFTEKMRISYDPNWSWEPVKATDRGLTHYATLSKINAQVVTVKPPTLSEGVYVLEYEAVDDAGLTTTCTFKVTVQVTRCPGLLPPSPPFGQLDLVLGKVSCSSAVYGSQCRQSCRSGYRLTDTEDTLLNCTRNSDSTTIGTWKGTVGNCEPNQCTIPDVRNGYVSGCSGNVTEYNSICQFQCNTGHKSPNGHVSVNSRCKADESWTVPSFECEEVFCSASFSLTNGQVSPSECGNSTSLPYGTLCRFSCNNGFLVQGPIFKQCLSDGTWSDVRNTSCKDQEAPQFTVACPQYIDAGARSGTTEAMVSYMEPVATDNSGNVTMLKSPDNLGPGSIFPEGTRRIIYTAMDATGLARQCVVHIRVNVQRCQRLPAPLRGSYDSCSLDTPVGSSCSFKCNEGYVLNGPVTHTCELDEFGSAYWSGNETTCQAITCPAVQTNEAVIKSGCFSEPPQTERYGTTCQLYCPYGYGGVGESKARCLANSSWSGEPEQFRCEERTCSPLRASAVYQTVPASCTSDPSYLDTCIHTCQRSGYRLQPAGHEFTTCLGNGQWTRDTSNLTCIDIERPRFSYCPQDIRVYADRGSTETFVNWTLPVAEDNSGEPPSLTSNICPCVLPVGEHDVVYVATDGAGNQQTCEFTVKVTVRRCQLLQPPIYAYFTGGSCDNSYGTTCEVVCSTGYQLSGSSNATCEFDGTFMYWERESQPYCTIATCSGLTPPENGDLYPSFCTTLPTYGTACQYFCRRGYVLDPDVGALTCTSSGTWDGDTTTPECKDMTSPHLLSCPGPQSGVLEGTNPTVTISWEVPTAVDNAPGQLRVEVTPSGIAPPHNFSQDTEVIYTFYDATNNSVECRFPIYIQDELLPVVKSCPADIAQTTTKANTPISWDPPVFEELTHDPLIIVPNPAEFSSSTYTLGEHFVTYTATNPDNGKSAVCSFRITLTAIKCIELDPPQNGALSCADWGDRLTCTLLCNEAFDIPRGQSGEKLYLCRNDGIWTPHDNVPDCTAGRNPRSNRLPSKLQYFSGDCTDPDTKNSIAIAFVQLVTGSGFCSTSDGCSVDGVEITCGPISAAGKRRKRRSINTHTITINFQFRVGLSILPGGVLTESDWLASEERLIEIADNFSTVLNTHGESLNVPGLQTEVDAASFWRDDWSYLACDYGYTANYNSLKCVGCGTGRYYNGSQDDCARCPVGTYQDQFGQTSCIPCPEGFTTVREEARNLTKCLPMCPLGQYSTTGVEPCSPCPKNTYQPMNGSKQCIPCPNGTRTVTTGAQSVDSCHEPCAAGSVSLTGVQPCQPCARGRYQPSTGKTTCVPCETHLTTVTEGSISSDDCKDPCNNFVCSNGGACIFTSGNTSCNCPAGFEGEKCETNIDDCSSQPCLNNATCVDGVNNHTCNCADGFSGAECAMDIDECESSPCQNNGTCEDKVNGYTCRCFVGYEGPRCEEETNWCAENPCRNGGTCISSVEIANFSCQCNAGFRGDTCDTNIDECQSHPCQNNGTCIDLVNGFMCRCHSGYSGPECQTDLDLCEDNPCRNNGTCVDLGFDFKCVCAQNRGGKLCEDVVDACTREPCQNGGTCTVSGDGLYSCTCGPGYAGFHCEDNIDECASQPCSNGGTCHDGHNRFSCDCHDGFTGTTCVDVINRCTPSPCANNGTCTVRENGTIMCVCPAGYDGDTCDQLQSSCVNNQCAQGSTCQEEDSSYSCVCPQGYTGFFCDSPIDNCASEPCFNNAICESTNSSYTCICPEGLEGEHCTNDTDECFTSPCLNNGTCINSFGSYECICDDGYAGQTCNINVDECSSRPCLNGGACTDSVNGYSCTCAQGYGGEHCSEEANECLSIPCLHGATCTDMFNGFTCQCSPGWEGDTCEINKDDCAEAPCQHNGTCVDLVDDYQCECPGSYRGKNCSVRTVSCTSRPCNNSGTCVEEEDGGIHCTCTEGWTGKYCQVNQDDCTPNPCGNGGNCLDMVNGYRCECSPSFTGNNCEEEVDECLEHDCLNGATCEDRLGHYFCRCANGYEGARCEEETDECNPNPCQNGATCTDELATFHCTCSTGFQGEFCDENIDDCETSSCENGGVCIDGINSFTCLCKDGYSGLNCSLNVDECASSPCGDNALCHDGIGTYNCICKPGFTGRDCETELSPDYDLHFPGSSTSDYSILTDGIRDSMKVLRMGTWVRSSATRGTIISYATQNGNTVDNVFSMSNPGNIIVTIGGESVTTHVRVDDSEWHHLAVKWLNRGSLAVYKDGEEVFSTRDVHRGYVILPGGYIVLGQMQTQLGGGFQAEDTFSGDISQLYIWEQALRTAEHKEMASSCSYALANSIRAWPEFRWSLQGQVAEHEPSRCDDFNECDSSPCSSGSTCINLPGSYECRCPPGFTGQQCDQPIDFCVVSLCQNGATCHSGQTNYTCQCDEGYFGTFCQEKLGDGRWSPWLNWSPCTQTCGGGMHTRQRLCNNPPPAEGGKTCEGPSSQEQPCNTDKCPECIELTPSETANLDCNTINATITCTAACKTGYGFTEQTLERYTCGPETAYLWPHQSTENIEGKLPECTAVTVPSAIVVDTYNGYSGQVCQSQHHKETIESQLSTSVEREVRRLSCWQTDDCRLKEVEAVNCQLTQSSRRKRQEDDEDIVYVRITYEGTMAVEDDAAHVNDTALYIEQLTEMAELFNATRDWINSDVLTVQVDGQTHSPSEASLQYGVRYLCEEGSVPSTTMCAKCPPGSFWIQHACVKCPVGSYQEVEGMTDCEECPPGMTTNEEGALDITSCYRYSTPAPNVTATRPSGSQGSNTTLVAALTSSIVIAVLAIAGFGVILGRHRRKAKIGCTNEEETCPTRDTLGRAGVYRVPEGLAHLELENLPVENEYVKPYSKPAKDLLPPINFKTSEM